MEVIFIKNKSNKIYFITFNYFSNLMLFKKKKN